MPILTIDASRIDWELLRHQKNLLLTTSIQKARVSPPDAAMLDGLITLLDDLQDQAAEQLGEVVVFGEHTTEPRRIARGDGA